MPGLGTVQKDGTFAIAMPNSGPGVYYTFLSARGSALEDFYSKSVLYGGKDITVTGLTLPASPAALEIVIAGDGATRQGTVLNARDEPVDAATVVALPSNPKLQRWTELDQPVNTDQNGRFLIRGLRPGEYQVFAWQDIDAYAFLDPEFMRPYRDRGQTLKAQANGRYAVVLHALDTPASAP